MSDHIKRSSSPKHKPAQAANAKHSVQKVVKQKNLTPGQEMVKRITGIATVKISADKVLSITRGRP